MIINPGKFTREQLQTAVDCGHAAAKEGRSKAPAQDPRFMDFYKKLGPFQVGEGLPLLRSFICGFRNYLSEQKKEGK